MTVLILRLSSIRDTATSSTHRLLADLVRSADPSANVDFAFLPPKRSSVMTGLFSGRRLADFDLILVTNSFVQETLNLPWMLHANGIAPWASDRPETFPPIIMGGSNALASQCLVRPDGTAVADALFFGEAEGRLPLFVTRWQSAGGNKRQRLINAAHEIDGFWITGALPDTSTRQAIARTPPPPAALLPLLDTEASGSIRLTVAHGCAAFCSFCFEGYERKPYREHTVADMLVHAKSLKRSCGARVAELDAFNLNNYTGLSELVEQVAKLFDKISFKSQRADGVAACPEIIDLERATGKSTFTLGIEGISPRTRAFLSKSLSDEEITTAIRSLLDRRVRELKLFFILTAYETADDLAAFSDFCIRLKNWLDQPNACTRVVLSFGRLVRMPNTPLAFDRLFLHEDEWRFAVDGVAAVCRRTRLECRFAFDWPDYLGTQLLAACGHEAAEAVVKLACEGLSYHGPWRAEEANRLRETIALDDSGVNAHPRFPYVCHAVSTAFLKKRWGEAQQALDGGYCLGTHCLGCGACGRTAERQVLTERVRTPQITENAIATITRIEAEKRRLQPLYLRATLPAEFSEHSASWVSARLLQLFLTQYPEQTENLLTVEEALFAKGENEKRLVIPAGHTVLMLKAWNRDACRSIACPDLDLSPFSSATFTPGIFAKTAWDIHTQLPARDAAQQASAWLQELRLTHTLRRADDGWKIDLAPASAKKRIIFTLEVHPSDTGTVLNLSFSPKAQIRDLLSRLSGASAKNHLRCKEILLPS